jgi:hypothetical protein
MTSVLPIFIFHRSSAFLCTIPLIDLEIQLTAATYCREVVCIHFEPELTGMIVEAVQELGS